MRKEEARRKRLCHLSGTQSIRRQRTPARGPSSFCTSRPESKPPAKPLHSTDRLSLKITSFSRELADLPVFATPDIQMVLPRRLLGGGGFLPHHPQATTQWEIQPH